MTDMPYQDTIPVWDGLARHIQKFKLIIFDLWGVMHDGISLHKKAEHAVLQCRAAGIATVFLSNAPRPRHYVRGHLRSMGLSESLTDLVVTSGGLARDFVREHAHGKALYHLGPDMDHNTIEGLPVTTVKSPDEADVILATDLDHHDIDAHAALLENAARRQVPFLCANPDRVVHVGSVLVPCAGAVADLYAEMGGPVHWFGKPTPEALWSCAAEAGLSPDDVSDQDILIIGDSLQTDIAGARAAGVSGCLVASGIHRDDLLPHTKAPSVDRTWFKTEIAGEKPIPDAILSHLYW